MYNRYLDQNAAFESPSFHFSPSEASQAPNEPPAPPSTQHKNSGPLNEITSGLSSFLGGLLQHFSLEKLDTGDILLVLIILFLFLEGDNLELVITLGLMLLLGLGDD